MHIALCDDDSLELNRMSSLLDEYRREVDASLTYTAFQSAAELCATLSPGKYEMLLLDVLMPGMSGMQAAHEIRELDEGVRIVFVTASPEFALESYAVKASDYLLKPVSKERLFEVLINMRAQAEKPMEGFSIKTRTGMAKVLYSQLAFVEIMNKRLYFHMADGSLREATAPLSEFEGRLLCRPEFIKAHRSYIVNLWLMNELGADSLVAYSGETIPVSRLLYPKVRKAYMEHLFVEKGVE